LESSIHALLLIHVLAVAAATGAARGPLAAAGWCVYGSTVIGFGDSAQIDDRLSIYSHDT